MIIKIHKTGDNKKIVAICDNNLIGKKFEEKNLQLDLTSNFYNGEEKTEREIVKLFHEAYIINLVRNDSINLRLKEGITSRDRVVYIKKVPRAQVILD